MSIEKGHKLAWERTFTRQDVEDFARVSNDVGRHHQQVDDSGRLMVHGLLTATLPTKLGGDMNYIARDMIFDFLRPVFTGDTIRCGLEVVDVELEPGRRRLRLVGTCTNQHGKEVLRFRSEGVVIDS